MKENTSSRTSKSPRQRFITPLTPASSSVSRIAASLGFSFGSTPPPLYKSINKLQILFLISLQYKQYYYRERSNDRLFDYLLQEESKKTNLNKFINQKQEIKLSINNSIEFHDILV